MMVKQRSTQIRVGIFVFCTLVTFMAAIFLLGSRTQYFQPQYTLKAVFSNVGYILEGAGVYLAGVQVGRVGRDPVLRRYCGPEGLGLAEDRP